jgi:hypothetical protein
MKVARIKKSPNMDRATPAGFTPNASSVYSTTGDNSSGASKTSETGFLEGRAVTSVEPVDHQLQPSSSTGSFSSTNAVGGLTHSPQIVQADPLLLHAVTQPLVSSEAPTLEGKISALKETISAREVVTVSEANQPVNS